MNMNCERIAIVALGAVALLVFQPRLASAKIVDKKCVQGKLNEYCLLLRVKNGKVFAESSGGGDFPGKLEIGNFDSRGTSLVPSTEAPILYSRTDRGWVAVITAFVPPDFALWSELRLYIFDPQGKRAVTKDLYISLGRPNRPDFRMGKLFNTKSELLQVGTYGEHSYAVETFVWLLPEIGAPAQLIDVPGAVTRVQKAESGQDPGLWIDHETYDGVHSETKGFKAEFWVWNEQAKKLTPANHEATQRQ
jgi:hypothetical protein